MKKTKKFLIYIIFIFVFCFMGNDFLSVEKLIASEQQDFNGISYSKYIKTAHFADNKNIEMMVFNRQSTEIVDLQLIFKNSGRIAEKKFSQLNFEGKMGIADFLFYLIEMGSDKYEKIEDFRAQLNKNRILFDISQGNENINLKIRCLRKDLEGALDLIFDALFRPNFSVDNMEIAKNKLSNEIKNSLQNNQFLAYQYFQNHILQDSIYDFSLPNLEILKVINKQNCQEYHRQILLNPMKIKIVAVGNFENEDYLQNLLSKYLVNDQLSIGWGLENSENEANIDINWSKYNSPLIIEAAKNNAQSIIYFSYPGLKISDPDYLKMSLLVEHIGGRGSLVNMLMKKLRVEKGLTYGAYIWPVWLSKVQMLVGNLATDNKNNKQQIADDIKEIFVQVAEAGLTNEELQDLKNKAKNRLAFNFKNNRTILDALIFLENNQLGIDYYDFYKNSIDNISLEEINQFAKRFLNVQNLSFVVY